MDMDKYQLINEFLDCIREANELDSEDSDKDDILIGLTELCMEATYLPTKSNKRQWVKPWRNARKERGSFAFITKELELSDEASYKNYLRVSKAQFKTLLNLIQQDVQRKDTLFREAITAAEKLALTLRFLATGETFQSLDYQSRVSKCTISNIIPEVCKILWTKLGESHLKFPNSVAEWEIIAKEFAIKWQFPNCLGALDGKHITFRPPRKDGAFFHNYKGTNSIILMALVDANCKFIFVNIGCNGRCNDAGVFLQSKLSNVLHEGQDIPPNAIVGNGRCLPYVVVADDAFPLQNHLLKPYPFHTNSNEKQIFNKRLSRARHVVEHSFGMLSNRFRVFLSPMNLKVETVEIVTFACCALHNYLIQTDDTYAVNMLQCTSNENNNNNDNPYNPRKGAAEVIRQEFMSYFNNEGKLDWMF